MRSQSLRDSCRLFTLRFFIMTTAVLLSDVAGAQARFEVLHAFSSCDFDGCVPFAPVVQGNDGNFYGTTQAGKIYRLTPDGAFTVLHSFLAPWEGGVEGLLRTPVSSKRPTGTSMG